MKKKYPIPTLFFLLIVNLTIGQINFQLAKQIDSLGKEDQKWRVLTRQIQNHEVDSISINKAWYNMRKTDSLNFIAVKALFDKYGFIGIDKVGSVSANNFWLMVQHADKYPAFQDSVLRKMKVEAEKGNASMLDYAYLVDRVKVNTGQLQIYGSQMTLNSTETSYEPKPVFEPNKLNERRKLVGLDSIEEYINTMNEHYRGTLKTK